MSMVGGLDLHRRQITFEVVCEGGDLWRGRIWADRARLRRWLREDLAASAAGQPAPEPP